MFDCGLGQGRDMRKCRWKGKMIDGLLPLQFLVSDEDEEFWHEGSFSLNDAKWSRAYIGCRFIFFFFFLKKNWHRHAKFLHKCAKWSRGLILLHSLRWISHSHAKCSHDDAKWSRGLKLLQLSLSVLHSHAKISHDHVNWDRDSFFKIFKAMKTPLFLAWIPLFLRERAKWWWTFKTHFSLLHAFHPSRKCFKT